LPVGSSCPSLVTWLRFLAICLPNISGPRGIIHH
jgi:hypothetical protein